MSNIKLKPLRDYSEHDVVNLFSLNAASGNKGSAVSILGNGFVNGNSDKYSTRLGVSQVAGTYVPRHEVTAKVGLASSGEKAFGIALYDVREVDEFGESYVWKNAQKKAEREIVVSGEALPILRKGILMMSGIQKIDGSVLASTDNPTNSGIKVSNTGNGNLVVCSATDTAKIGSFLGSPDTDGFALVTINAY